MVYHMTTTKNMESEDMVSTELPISLLQKKHVIY